MKKRSYGEYIGKILTYIFLAVVTLVNLFPFYWALISSLKETNKIFIAPVTPPLESFKFVNYVEAWIKAKVGIYFFNTVYVAALTIVLTVLMAAMAAYILARVWRSFWLYTYFILGIMIPIHSLVVPDFIIISKLGLINTRLSLVLVDTGYCISITTFILTGFMLGLPKDIEEAAIIDGANRFRIFRSIILPLTKPALATTGILVFLFAWNNYLLPLVFITAQEYKVLSQGIQGLKRLYTVDYGLMTAGIVIAIIPVLVAYMLFQEHVVKGMTAGAVKG
jgi:raffinose/stachyose/melibiose transport system permease protein